MAETTEYDLIVIGGGPAGYAGAIRAGQLGKKVACIELERAGGTCLNWGCIPTKALLKSAEFYRSLQKADTFGIAVKDIGFDFGKVMDRSRNVAGQMAKGVEFLFRKNKVDYFVGRAQVTVPGMVEVTEGERVLTSREALEPRKSPPKSIVIIGAGAIGVEFAYFYNAFGTKVTLVEMLPQLVPVEDEEVAKALQRSFEKQGMTVHVNTKVENVRTKKDKVELTLVKAGEAT